MRRVIPPSTKAFRRTQEEAFFHPILSVLRELGGSAKVDPILRKVERRVGHTFTQDDRAPIKSGEPRWRNTAKRARKRLVERGLLKANSPRGWWELSERGRQEAER